MEFPLLFSNNTVANPKVRKGRVSFSEVCGFMVNGGDPEDPNTTWRWQSPSENGGQNGYTLCPPELMK